MYPSYFNVWLAAFKSSCFSNDLRVSQYNLFYNSLYQLIFGESSNTETQSNQKHNACTHSARKVQAWQLQL